MFDHTEVRTQLSKIEVELDATERDAEALNRRREALRQVRDGYRAYLSSVGAPDFTAESGGADSGRSETKPAGRRIPEGLSFRQATRQVLVTDPGALLSPKAILAVLQQAGYKPKSANPLAAVHNALADLKRGDTGVSNPQPGLWTFVP